MEEKFSFSKSNLTKAKQLMAKYPQGRQKSAVLPLLELAQRQHDGWLSVAVMEYVADLIAEPYMRVYEVASFYTMFNLKPVGRYHIQLCGTTPCWLMGADGVKVAFENATGTKCGQTSSNGLFTISEVECLGACRNAPVVQINDDFYEDLNAEKIEKIVKKMKVEK